MVLLQLLGTGDTRRSTRLSTQTHTHTPFLVSLSVVAHHQHHPIKLRQTFCARFRAGKTKPTTNQTFQKTTPKHSSPTPFYSMRQYANILLMLPLIFFRFVSFRRRLSLRSVLRLIAGFALLCCFAVISISMRIGWGSDFRSVHFKISYHRGEKPFCLLQVCTGELSSAVRRFIAGAAADVGFSSRTRNTN